VHALLKNVTAVDQLLLNNYDQTKFIVQHVKQHNL